MIYKINGSNWQDVIKEIAGILAPGYEFPDYGRVIVDGIQIDALSERKFSHEFKPKSIQLSTDETFPAKYRRITIRNMEIDPDILFSKFNELKRISEEARLRRMAVEAVRSEKKSEIKSILNSLGNPKIELGHAGNGMFNVSFSGQVTHDELALIIENIRNVAPGIIS